MSIYTNDYVVQQPYLPEDTKWYVQRVALLDYGRFHTKEAAEEHKQYLIEKHSYT